MITKDQYSELKNKIVEAVPEIMELKFGCRVLLEDDVVWTIYESMGDSVGVIHNHERRCPSKNQITKIIGRPITLADVLLALEKTHGHIAEHLITSSGRFGVISGEDRETGAIHQFSCSWDLTKDLDDQSDATKQFLYDLLCKPNN